MKSKAGIKDVVEVQPSEKLKRRATAKGRTVAESAMIRAFNAQFAEYSSELKKGSCYWPVSAFDVAINIVHEEAVLNFCRKEDVKRGLYKYVEGLIERKMISFALHEADTLPAVLKEIESFEFPVLSKDGDCRVGEKRKGF
ncbi:hypothetical protein CARUB_v10011526mg [Capsella rubella]|uniref:Uncharacterized protein n=1 Tax=Capsella rubella TaxID=81985 RepID=R0GSX4_9BRAS|nr:hypothetical protein CARUB_v10011526mg [Capsella rubella]